MNDFSKLPLSRAMIENLGRVGYTEMTPIQTQSIPCILNKQDVMAQAKTGSGKTAAFAIGILEQLTTSMQVQALILCPTRELSEQVAQEIRRLARFTDNIKVLTLCGGTPIRPQTQSLEHGAHIVVGTPGRIGDHVRRGNLDLNHVATFILDEGDRLLEMGFEREIDDIVSCLPKKRQTHLFSATFPDAVKDLSRRFQTNAREIKVESLHAESVIAQRFYEVEEEKKPATTAAVLWTFKPASTMIFCKTKRQCRDLLAYLTEKNFHALCINSDFEQKQRTEMLTLFANRSTNILIGTDVAARGLDIKDVSAVINFDMPLDPPMYVHRIGRTGRAGKEGLAFSLATPKEKFRLEAINAFQHSSFGLESAKGLDFSPGKSFFPPMTTISINGGRKSKIRPGDILGALTTACGIDGKLVGKIDVFDLFAYVAVDRSVAREAVEKLSKTPVKGKRFIVRLHEERSAGAAV